MNRVILTNARLVKDLELKYANSGTALLDFTVAVAREYKREESDFINCVAFGKTAELIAQHFHKGSVIALEGSIQVSNYENKEGQKVYQTKVIVNKMEFPLGNKKESGQTNNSSLPKGNNDLMPIDDEEIPF